MFVYQLSCRAGEPAADCLKIDPATEAVEMADQSLCASFSPSPEQVAFVGQSGAPLAFHSGLQAGLDALQCSSTPDETDPTDPGDGTDTGPGFGYDPPPDDPVDEMPGDSYYWNIGDWGGGEMVCGRSTTLTRQVECRGNVVVDYDWSDESNPQPIYEDVRAPYSACASYMAQTPPATTYAGSRANCGYESIESGMTEWELPFWASGTASCSEFAFRHSINRCVDSAGRTVDAAFCEQGLGPNGGYGPNERYEYGNYENCAPTWKVVEAAPACDGPDLKSLVEAQCVRPDGTVLTGAAANCDQQTKPEEGYKVVGRCVKKADYRRIDGAPGNCSGGPIAQMHGTADHQGLYWPIWTSDDYRMAKQQCIDSGASCCAFNSDNGFARMFAFAGPFSPSEPKYFSFPISGSVPYQSASPNSLDGDAYAVLEPRWVPEGYLESVPYPWVR